VPHVAGPLHVRDIPILVDRALRDAHLSPKACTSNVSHSLQDTWQDLDAVAFTLGPGLAPCLQAALAFSREVWCLGIVWLPDSSE
jgi:tRNA A37 threonylcarbamoyltransferase TsaD